MSVSLCTLRSFFINFSLSLLFSFFINYQFYQFCTISDRSIWILISERNGLLALFRSYFSLFFFLFLYFKCTPFSLSFHSPCALFLSRMCSHVHFYISNYSAYQFAYNIRLSMKDLISGRNKFTSLCLLFFLHFPFPFHISTVLSSLLLPLLLPTTFYSAVARVLRRP